VTPARNITIFIPSYLLNWLNRYPLASTPTFLPIRSSFVSSNLNPDMLLPEIFSLFKIKNINSQAVFVNSSFILNREKNIFYFLVNAE